MTNNIDIIKTEKSLKASVYIATSLDGFIAREDGSLDWLTGSDGSVDSELEGEDFGFASFMDSIDVLVMGRNTYDLVFSSGHWPYGSKQVKVLSSTLSKNSDSLPSTVEIKSCAPDKLYAELKTSGVKHLYVDGGKTIQSFLRSGLIDEITITRVPVIIGSGIPLFGALKNDVRLDHLVTKAFKNGFVQSKYAIIKRSQI